MYFLGIDIGGTKISIALGKQDGSVIKKEKFTTLKNDSQPSSIEKILLICKAFCTQYKIEAIGVSAPGPISVKRGSFLYPPNLPGWENYPIVDVLKNHLHLPVYFNNDANAAVLAEYRYGEFKGCNNLVYLTASSGMGAGIIAEGNLLQGITDTAGEVGHMPLEIRSSRSSAGIFGSFESFCGGLAMADHIQQELTKTKVTSILNDLPLSTITMEKIIDAVSLNDAYAIKKWNEFIERLAQGIGILIMVLNPEAIVLGTIAMHAKHLLMNPLMESLPRFCWKEPLDAVKIKASILDNIGDLGALSLALHLKDV